MKKPRRARRPPSRSSPEELPPTRRKPPKDLPLERAQKDTHDEQERARPKDTGRHGA